MLKSFYLFFVVVEQWRVCFLCQKKDDNMASGYFWPLGTSLKPLVHSVLMDKFIIPIHSKDKPRTPSYTWKKAVKGIKFVMLKELWESEKDLTSQIWDNMNFNKDKNCKGLKHVKYV